MRLLPAWIFVMALTNQAVAEGVEGAALEHLDHGIASYRLGDYEAALRELDIAQHLVPERPNPYRWLALTHQKLGDCKAAVVSVESFLSRVPAGDPRVPELVALREDCVHASSVVTPPLSPPVTIVPPAKPPPIYRRWWFWTAVGVTTVSAIGITYAATRNAGDTTLPTIHCDATGCR